VNRYIISTAKHQSETDLWYRQQWKLLPFTHKDSWHHRNKWMTIQWSFNVIADCSFNFLLGCYFIIHAHLLAPKLMHRLVYSFTQRDSLTPMHACMYTHRTCCTFIITYCVCCFAVIWLTGTDVYSRDHGAWQEWLHLGNIRTTGFA
jgi:hypothetical protein